jgi:ubiquinone/menaquinone biosynthesis C-methylase UbiE
MLGSDARRDWLRVDEAIKEKTGIGPGAVCVDLGCGAGAFSIPLAETVGETGKVYAVDTGTEVLDVLRSKNPPPNLVIIQKDAASTELEPGIADLCLMVLLLHEVPPEGVLAEAFRLLKPGGSALVMEWKEGSGAPGPPDNERIGRERIERLLAGAGFASFDYAGWTDSHYIATALKPAEKPN